MDKLERPQAVGLKRALGLGNLVLFGLVAVGPIAGVTMYGFVADVSGGAVVPSYLVAALGICLSALSFATMAETAPGAGSVYGYVAHGLGPLIGVIGGWMMLLDYILLNALVIVFGAYYLVGALPGLPLSGVATAFSLFSMTMALLGISWSSKVDIAVTLMQVAVVALVVGGWIAGLGGAQAVQGMPQVWPDTSGVPLVMAGASAAIIAFLGFDAISTLAEEVAGPGPGRAVAQATILTVVSMTAVFVLTGLALAALSPGVPDLQPATAAFQIISWNFPAMTVPLGVATAIAVGMGGNLACTLGASRLLFALTRDGHLPGAMDRVHGRWRSPWVAVLVVWALAGVLSLIALDQVDVLGGLVSFGALSGFLLVNLSVIASHGLRGGSRRWLRHWVLPAAGAAVVLYTIWGIQTRALELGLAWVALGLTLQGAMRLARRGASANT